MNFANARVEAHNIWPAKTSFKAEEMFIRRLSEIKDKELFKPISIAQNSNADYQRCVGHLLDALDQVPHRPDYAFDNFFRIIDIAASPWFSRRGIKGIVQGTSSRLFTADSTSWEQIIDSLCLAMPLRTYELLAKRLLAAALTQEGENDPLYKRALHAFGPKFYPAFVRKYALDKSGNLCPNIAETNRGNAASLLKLYMSGKAGTRSKPASDPALDLTKKENLGSPNQRSEVLLSLLLFTIRNERAHGNVLSPFRTSKSTLERYESYYFIMLLSYIYALGVLSLRFQCISPKNILNGCTENIQAQKAFFS
ncbi:hypothetical protein ACM0P6_09045 [Komagataeibacter sucrofermentans]|uniref:hypothetical protein n=1 Tax=Komagataeibacter sucrofermentans TaxID=1053551 RepID=UPI0011B4385C|nr:hypothetical protein [Komagataeibacter sucrofermentans]GBQ43486.1 hypothetical protein AA15973_0001 [Komagataeibacter sucrofermentans DSM 15973]